MKNSVTFVLLISAFVLCFVNQAQADDGLLGGLGDLLTGGGHHRNGHHKDKGLIGGLKDLLTGDKDNDHDVKVEIHHHDGDCDGDCDGYDDGKYMLTYKFVKFSHTIKYSEKLTKLSQG